MGSGKLTKIQRQHNEKYKKKYLYCVKCAKNVQVSIVTGAKLYPSRKDLRYKKFCQCPECKNYCTYGTLKVSIPTPELRAVRRKIHAIIDPLWKSGMVSRGWVYKNMSELAGYEFHSGTIKDVEEGERLLNISLRVRDKAMIYYAEKVRRWKKK